MVSEDTVTYLSPCATCPETLHAGVAALLNAIPTYCVQVVRSEIQRVEVVAFPQIQTTGVVTHQPRGESNERTKQEASAEPAAPTTTDAPREARHTKANAPRERPREKRPGNTSH